jgi:hypothetical protein
MNDAGDDETARAAQAFRPNTRPVLIAVLANVVLAGLCLGVPYARGHAQGEQSLRAYARFAGCLFGAEPQPTLGLGMPEGERARFAAQVMRGPQDWPARCRAPLRAIAPEPAVFLWPSVKQAAEDVRATVELLDRELLALDRARKAGSTGRVPTRPLLALGKLRGALSLLARAADADATLDSDAVKFGGGAEVIDPSRLPLVASGAATLDVVPTSDGLDAVALDGGGVSWLRLEDGKVERLRVRRTSLLRGALRAGEHPLLVWAMPEARCAEQDNRCVKRATGFAELPPDALALPKPIWVAGHPAGRFDRSVSTALGARVDLLARASAEGHVEIRRFDLSTPADAGPKGDAADSDATPPRAATAHFELPAGAPPADALLLSGEPRAVAYAVADGDDMEARLFAYESNGTPLSLGRASGPSPFVEACSADRTRWIAYGTARALALSRVTDGGAPSQPLPETALSLGPLVPRNESARDRVRVLCSADHATVLVHGADRVLTILRCDAEACARAEVAPSVAAFDAALSGDDAVVAYSRDGHPQIAVVRLDARGAPRAPPITPAPCWDPEGGMCGQPTLLAARERLLLCARESSDLLVLESNDGGAGFAPLRGLRVHSTVGTDAGAPMQQHRRRHGLD